MRIRVKFCGMTNAADAMMASELGADAIGLNFCPQSPRYVSPDQALSILAKLPPFMTVVGVFVNATSTEIAAILKTVSLDKLQFHGDESPQFCESFQKPYYKAIRMQEHIQLDNIANLYHTAQAILVDTYLPHLEGGTGEVFDWQRLPPKHPVPLILAGGLTPENIYTAIKTVHPYAVDVASGIEATPREKDHAKMAAFMREVERANIAEARHE